MNSRNGCRVETVDDQLSGIVPDTDLISIPTANAGRAEGAADDAEI